MTVKQQLNFWVAVGILLLLLGACKDEKNQVKAQPEISEIQCKDNRVRVGKSVDLYVDILKNPSSLGLKFDWEVDNGDISSGSTKVTYLPNNPGPAYVDLEVKNSDNDAIIVTKRWNTQVEPAVTPINVIAQFRFSGWMGDAEKFGTQAFEVRTGWTDNPHSPPSCVRITYRIPDASEGWAGVYAQYNVQNSIPNWGRLPGMDLSDGYTRLVFYARGETGEELVEFKCGGIDDQGADNTYKDSFAYSMGTVQLAQNWTRYEMPLLDYDLSSVIGGFCVVATKDANPNGVTLYVDSITYE